MYSCDACRRDFNECRLVYLVNARLNDYTGQVNVTFCKALGLKIMSKAF